MTEGSDVRNEAVGVVTGSVVQAGSIQQVLLAGSSLSGKPLVPRQLPLAVRDFTGRAEQLAALDAMLRAAQDEADMPGAVMISAVDGTAGVGKTALALHWAHRVQHCFPDGTLHVNLRGYGPDEPVKASEVLDGFLRAMGIPSERIPIDEEARAGLYRSLLATRRMLIVLDNANAAEQVRPLLPGSRGSLVVVTSRCSLIGLMIGEAATRMTLDLLSPTEAIDLMSSLVGQRRTEAEPEAVIELTRLCARLPLALRIAGSRIAAHPYLCIADLVAELADDRTRLDALSTSADHATTVRAVFGWSYQKLTTEQARLFRRLGLHSGSAISVHAAAAAAERPVTHIRRLLDNLAEVHLIEPVARDRYQFHDLLHAYAGDRAQHDDMSADRNHAVRAVLDWYVHTAARADRLLFPAYLRLPVDLEQPSGEPLVLSERAGALTWLDTERSNLVAAIRYAAGHGLSRRAIHLVHFIETFLYRQARWDELFDICALGIEAARRVGDRASEAWFLIRSGWARLQLSRWAEAVNDLLHALALARELNNRYLEAYALNDLGLGCLRRNQYVEALAYLRPALPLSQGTDSGRQEAFVRSNISSALASLGHYDLALKHAEHSLTLRRQAGDYEGEIFSLNQLAQVWQRLGSHPKVIALCEAALSIEREYAYRPDIAATLDTLGMSLRHCDNAERVLTCWHEALEIFDEFADHRAPDLRTRVEALQAADHLSD